MSSAITSYAEVTEESIKATVRYLLDGLLVPVHRNFFLSGGQPQNIMEVDKMQQSFFEQMGGTYTQVYLMVVFDTSSICTISPEMA